MNVKLPWWGELSDPLPKGNGYDAKLPQLVIDRLERIIKAEGFELVVKPIIR